MRPKVTLTLAILMCATGAMAATFVVPTDQELVAKADAIATGTVEGSFVQELNGTIETVYEIRADRALKGAVRPNDLLRVVANGGIIGDRGLLVPGEAHYRQGEHVLIFLTRDDRGRWRTTDHTLGRFVARTSTRGERLLVRDMEDVVGWDRAGQPHQEQVRREAGFLRFIEERAGGRPGASDYLVEASAVTLEPEPQQFQTASNATTYPAATYTDFVNNQPIRWPNLSNGVAVYKRSDQNIAGATDGGVSVIQSALAAWTNECGSLIVLNYAGQLAKASANHDSTNIVEFNDPQQRISGSWTGSGTVGFAFLSFAGTHTFQNLSWLNITDMDVVFQDGYTAANASFPAAMTHETGHGLGWRHSNQNHASDGPCDPSVEECTSAAIMNSALNANYGYTLQPWDINAAQSVYPGGTCGTPPPTCTAPAITAQPTSTTINAGASATLSVTASGTEPLSYQWYVGTSGSTSNPISGATSSSITVTPGATTSYWVRVSNACGAVNSNTATVTVNAPPPPQRNRTRADFDGDLRSELIWRNGNTLAMWDIEARTVTNGGIFGSVSSTAWRIEGYGDFTGDGRYDILYRNTSTHQVAVWVMNGRTMVSGNIVATLSDSRWNAEAFGDFTGDGRTDVIWRHSATGQVAMWEFTTSGALANGGIVYTVSDLNWRIQGAGDFDGDLDDELIWRHATTSQMAMWEFSGRTLVNGNVFATVSSGDWRTQGFGDFNRDGRDDILFRHATTDAVAVWDMNGRTIVNGNVVANVSSPNWVIQAVGDYDGDGDDEIIFFNTSTNQVAMWELANHQLVNGNIFATASGGWIIQPPFVPVR